MLTQTEIKYVRSLHSAHVAKKEGKFVAEGERMVHELLNGGFMPEILYTCNQMENNCAPAQKFSYITRNEMSRISSLESPPSLLAIFPRIHSKLLPLDSGCSLYLENVQDPGNLGTIIRTAAWFGIKQVICSEDTVNLYNHKVLQATMGAVGLIPVVYTSFESTIESAPKQLQIVATCLTGTALTTNAIATPSLLLFGNEGKGLSEQLLQRANLHITIPKGKGGQGESLNVASAVAIVCATAALSL